MPLRSLLAWEAYVTLDIDQQRADLRAGNIASLLHDHNIGTGIYKRGTKRKTAADFVVFGDPATGPARGNGQGQHVRRSRTVEEARANFMAFKAHLIACGKPTKVN